MSSGIGFDVRPASELKETGFWLLAIIGAAVLVYDIGWYGSLIARIH